MHQKEAVSGKPSNLEGYCLKGCRTYLGVQREKNLQIAYNLQAVLRELIEHVKCLGKGPKRGKRLVSILIWKALPLFTAVFFMLLLNLFSILGLTALPI